MKTEGSVSMGRWVGGNFTVEPSAKGGDRRRYAGTLLCAFQTFSTVLTLSEFDFIIEMQESGGLHVRLLGPGA